MQVVVDLEGVVFRVVFSPALNFYYFLVTLPPICSNLWALGLMNTRLVVFTYSYTLIYGLHTRLHCPRCRISKPLQ